jgi:hypothetical protein
LADTDSFPKQKSMRRFRGIVVDSAVLEHNGGRDARAPSESGKTDRFIESIA